MYHIILILYKSIDYINLLTFEIVPFRENIDVKCYYACNDNEYIPFKFSFKKNKMHRGHQRAL